MNITHLESAVIRLFRTFQRDCFVYQLRQTHPALNRFVIDEMKLWNYPKLQPVRQMTPQKSSCVLQSFTGEEIVVFAAQCGVENLGMSIIMTYLNTGQSDHANTRVFEFVANQIGQFTLNLVGNT